MPTIGVEIFDEILQYETQVTRKATFDPRKVAELINSIAEIWNMTSMYIIYNSRMPQNNLLLEVLNDLQTKDNYLEKLPRMVL